MGGKQSARLSGGPQPTPIVNRPVAAVAGVPRAGSREIANVDSAGLAEAGKVTGSPPQPVQQPLASTNARPAGTNNS